MQPQMAVLWGRVSILQTHMEADAGRITEDCSPRRGGSLRRGPCPLPHDFLGSVPGWNLASMDRQALVHEVARV